MKTLSTLVIALSVFAFASCYKPTETTIKKPTPTASAEKPTESPAQASPSPAADSSLVFDRAVKDYNAKDFDAAEKGFKEVIAKFPKNADALFYLGLIKAEKKDVPASVPYLQEAAKLDYKSVEKLTALGDAYFELKKFDTAIVEYGKIPGFEPNNANAYYKMGRTYMRLNNKIAARQQLKKLDALDKNLAEKLKKEIGD